MGQAEKRTEEGQAKSVLVYLTRRHSDLDGWECGKGNVHNQKEEATGWTLGKLRQRCLWDGAGLGTRYVCTERQTRTCMGAEDCRADERTGSETLCGP